jgi:hypothetical protein
MAVPASGQALRNGLLTAALAAALLLATAGSAGAVVVPATCSDLQAKLTAADDGQEIVLDGLCTGQYTLPSFPDPVAFPNNYKVWTLRAAGTDDGFDRQGVAGRALTGVDVHRLEIQNLIFKNSNAVGDGGALSITGKSSVGLRGSTFTNNDATGDGGAVFLGQVANPVPGSTLGGIGVSGNTFGSETNAALGNQAGGNGGALAIETPGQGLNSGVNTSTFANNVATGNGGGFSYSLPTGGVENFSADFNQVLKNKAGGVGGGAHIKVDSSTILGIDQNTFDGNSVEPLAGGPTGDHLGGGLFVETGGANPTQRNNVYANNQVKAFPSGNLIGGGEAIRRTAGAPNVSSQIEQWVGNSVAAAAGAAEAEGGGIGVIGDGMKLHAWLAVVAGNQMGAGGEGGGAYAGAPTTLEFADSTIAGNSTGAGGANAGLGGGGDDVLKLTNSIVSNPSTNPDIGGFATLNISYSDACQAAGTAFPGTANICANPLLRDPANGDIHETKTSPTIDKGNDQLFFDEEEDPVTDYEGDPRPVDGDGDGHTVDMGADESPAFVPPVTSSGGPAVTPQCGDGKDNDSDGAVDSADPGCATAVDNNEGDETLNDLVLCGRRQISLIRADAKGRKVVLNGLVASRFAGKTVTITANYGKKKLGTVRADSAGRFSARVKGPSRRLFNKARFTAKVDRFKSVSLKLPQSLASSSLRHVGNSIELRGKVKRSLLGKRNAVVVRRIVCGRYTTVGQAKPNRKGSYVVRFNAPGLSVAALYRAETKVLAKARSRRYVKQFARAIGITLTGQTG